MRFWEYAKYCLMGVPMAQKAGLYSNFNAIEAGTVIDIAVPSDRLLIRDVSLPKVPAASLTRAVELDVVRATPFQRETISINHAVLSSNKNGYLVREFVVRNADLEKWIQKAQAAGLSVRKVFPADEPSAVLSDLTSVLMQRTAFWRKLNVSLVVIIAILIGHAMWQPLSMTKKEQLHAEAVVAELRAQSLQLQSELDSLERQAQGVTLISDRLGSAADMLARIDRLTEALPDHTWLTYLLIDAEEMRLTGNVNGDPLNLLEDIAVFPEFANPVLTASFALNGSEGEQRFEIEVPFQRDPQ